MARRAAGDTGLTTFYLADLHFGAAFASGVRAEQVRTEIVDVVSREGKRHARVVICGDLFHRADGQNPGMEIVADATDFLRALGQHAEVVVFPGNHDSDRHGRDLFRMLSRLLLRDAPRIRVLRADEDLEDEACRMQVLPHPAGDGRRAGYRARADGWLVCAHASVRGTPITEERSVLKGVEAEEFLPEEGEARVDAVVGDIHTPSDRCAEPEPGRSVTIRVPGSPYPVTRSDFMGPRSVLLSTMGGGARTFTRVPLTSSWGVAGRVVTSPAPGDPEEWDAAAWQTLYDALPLRTDVRVFYDLTVLLQDGQDPLAVHAAVRRRMDDRLESLRVVSSVEGEAAFADIGSGERMSLELGAGVRIDSSPQDQVAWFLSTRPLQDGVASSAMSLLNDLLSGAVR